MALDEKMIKMPPSLATAMCILRQRPGPHQSCSSKHRKRRTHKPSSVNNVFMNKRENIRLLAHMLEPFSVPESCRTTYPSTLWDGYPECLWQWNQERCSWHDKSRPIPPIGIWPFGSHRLWKHCTISVSGTVQSFNLLHGKRTAACFWGTLTSVALTDAVKITLPNPCSLKIREAAWAE